MSTVYAEFSDDLEVVTLFGEAIMNRTPWALWDLKTGQIAEGANTAAAIVADRKFLKREGPINFYSLYRSHNDHFKIYGAMFLGQYRPAIETAEEMISTLPEALLQVASPPMADWLEGFISMKQHVYIRFGKWQEIIDQPLPENTELYCVTTAMMHYSKAVALAASGNVPGAEHEVALFDEAMAREMMLGEVAYRKGDFDSAFAHLRKSVELDDNLPYDEPWDWMQL